MHTSKEASLRSVAIERFDALKRQVPLLYAVVLVNMGGFLLIASSPGPWDEAIAFPLAAVILWRLWYWYRQPACSISEEQTAAALRKNFYFTLCFALAFSAWTFAALLSGTPEQQNYVVVFATLATIGSSTALATAPRAAVLPPMIIGIPVAAWLIGTLTLPAVVLGLSLTVALALICRMIVIHDEAFVSISASRAALVGEQERTKLSEERFRLASQATKDVIWDLDLRSNHIAWGDALYTTLGYSPDDVEPTLDWWASKIHPREASEVAAQFDKVVREGETYFSCAYRFARADGTYAHVFDRGYIVRNESGHAIRGVGAMQDVTAQKESDDLVLWNATHDGLTKLPNRALFQTKLLKALVNAKRKRTHVCLLQIDLDHFKQINDTLGHDAGDALLIAFADRLKAGLRGGDTVARLGGDEFAVVLPGIDPDTTLGEVTDSIFRRLKEPVVHDGHVMECRASVGASIYPYHGEDAEDLLKSADLALYDAKRSGRGNLCVYRPALREESRQRAIMLKDARAAIDQYRLVPHYQPKIDLASGSIVGFEALLRWRDAAGHVNSPASIAAAFENPVLAGDISSRMREMIVSDMQRWLEDDVRIGHIAINAGAAEFRSNAFADEILEALARARLPADLLQVEVTEKVFLDGGADYVRSALESLRAAGVSIALDDFGTGYAALSHLSEYPVDSLKVDQSFVRNLHDARQQAIVQAVIRLAHALGITSTAEGVEKAEQVSKLIELGCEYAQGYLFSEAVPAQSVPALLATPMSLPRTPQKYKAA